MASWLTMGSDMASMQRSSSVSERLESMNILW